MPALVVFIGLIVAGSVIPDNVPPAYFIYALSATGIFALALVWRAIRRARRRERYKSSSLSRDELSKARSKLMNRNKT